MKYTYIFLLFSMKISLLCAMGDHIGSPTGEPSEEEQMLALAEELLAELEAENQQAADASSKKQTSELRKPSLKQAHRNEIRPHRDKPLRSGTVRAHVRATNQPASTRFAILRKKRLWCAIGSAALIGIILKKRAARKSAEIEISA